MSASARSSTRQLTEKVKAFLSLCNEIRRHETLGQRRPSRCTVLILTDLSPLVSKNFDTGQISATEVGGVASRLRSRGLIRIR